MDYSLYFFMSEGEPIKMYYGKKEVLEINDGMEPNTKRIVMTDEACDLPSWEADACVVGWPGDESDIRNLRANVVVDKIYDLLKELNARIGRNDLPYVIQKLLSRIEGTEQKAVQNCFGISDDNDLRISHIESKLVKPTE